MLRSFKAYIIDLHDADPFWFSFVLSLFISVPLSFLLFLIF